MGTAPPREPPSSQRPPKRKAAYLRQRLIGLGAAVAGVLLSVSAHRIPYFSLDVAITHAVQGVSGDWFHAPLRALSAVGFAPLVAVFDGVFILVILAVWGWWDALASGFAASGAPGLQYLVKSLVARPRPPASLVHVAHHIGNPAFPAGHVLDITAFLGFVCYLAHLRLHPSRRRAALLALFFAVIALMGLARIDAGEHWASDVLGGYLFGTVWLVVTVEVHEWGRRRREGAQPPVTGALAPRGAG